MLNIEIFQKRARSNNLSQISDFISEEFQNFMLTWNFLLFDNTCLEKGYRYR